MKYILIKGAGNAGKSTTINAVCENLKPTKKFWLVYDSNNINGSHFKEVDPNSQILNGTYIIEINGIHILIVAGSPTEQSISITIIIDICIKLKFKIVLAYINMRSYEKKDGYDTESELLKFSKPIYLTRIYRIEQDNYHKTVEWKKRIETFTQIVKEHI